MHRPSTCPATGCPQSTNKPKASSCESHAPAKAKRTREAASDNVHYINQPSEGAEDSHANVSRGAANEASGGRRGAPARGSPTSGAEPPDLCSRIVQAPLSTRARTGPASASRRLARASGSDRRRRAYGSPSASDRIADVEPTARPRLRTELTVARQARVRIPEPAVARGVYVLRTRRSLLPSAPVLASTDQQSSGSGAAGARFGDLGPAHSTREKPEPGTGPAYDGRRRRGSGGLQPAASDRTRTTPPLRAAAHPLPAPVSGLRTTRPPPNQRQGNGPAPPDALTQSWKLGAPNEQSTSIDLPRYGQVQDRGRSAAPPPRAPEAAPAPTTQKPNQSLPSPPALHPAQLRLLPLSPT